MGLTVSPVSKLRGSFSVSGDKSITHRAFIFSSISRSEVFVRNPNRGEDVMRTLVAMQSVGAKAREEKDGFYIKGIGLSNVKEPENILYCGNSGTTMRLLSGLFAGINGKLFVTDGDESLKKRPMKRVIEPISLMGGKIWGRKGDSFAPLAIKGAKLHGISYKMKVASAQVKSAIILAALSADGRTVIEEKARSRNHTEIMLKEFGGKIETNGKITVYPTDNLRYDELFVPGDFSSAAYFIALALIAKDADIVIKNVGVNPTRSYLLEKLKDAGGRIELFNRRIKNGEPVCDISVKSSRLQGISIDASEVPLLIDEIPLIGVIGAFSEGKTIVRGASELRVKESDRIKLTVSNLKSLGIEAEEFEDGFSVKGGRAKYGFVKTAFDHRIALSFIIFALAGEGAEIEEVKSIDISFPEFFDILERVKNG